MSFKRRLVAGGVVLAALGSAAAVVPVVLRAPTRRTPDVREDESVPAATETGPTLRLATLNLAHGRGTGHFQLFQQPHDLRSHLEVAGQLLADHQLDAVALQEVDAASWWSGDFDHLAVLTQQAGMRWSTHGAHVDGAGLSYGTAVAARHPLVQPFSHTFAASPPSPPKGFTLAVLQAPGWPEIDVVSVHLDFFSPAARASQLDEIAAVLAERQRPVVIMGDLNGGWQGPARLLADALDLVAWEPEEEIVTFPKLGVRLDWVLVGRGIELVSHEVLPDPVSDHRAIVVELRLAEPAETEPVEAPAAEE